MALGFSVSSSTLHPEIHYTGRLAGDAPGTMTQGEGTIINGPGSQTGQALSRWGDYSNMTVDPADDCTFWFTTEYIPANGAFNWSTRIGSFKFPGCGGVTAGNDFSISASPASVSVAAGGSTSSSIATATTSGSAQTVSLTVTGAPAGVTGTLSPTSVTSGGSSTLSIATATTTAAGTYTLTVTGSAASGSHSTTVSLTVTAAGGGGCTATTQLFANPGFESGATGWTASPAVIDASTSGSAPRTGTVKAWLDGYGTTHTDDLSQNVTIPSTACSATLTFWLKITTAETTTTTAFDKLTVTVRNTAGTVLSTLATFSNLNKGTTYVQRTFDVTSFKGQTIKIQFHGTEDASLQTSFFIDDTALNVVQ